MDELTADGSAARNSGVGTKRPQGSADRQSLRLSASLIFAGVVVSLAAGLLHADKANANDHPAAFAEYAGSNIWIGVHLGQFVGMALLVAGLLVLVLAVDARFGATAWVARLGAVFAVTALALYGALQAVDGVALKHAVDAWEAAAEPEKGMRFATAEGIRWLEWGMRSYQSFVLGAALVMVGVAVAATRRVPGLIGYLMGLTGLAYVAQGWVIGTDGFSSANTVPTLAGIVLIVVWSVWLLVSAWRLKESPSPEGPSPTAGIS